MSTLTYDNSAVSELIGYVYTAAVSVLILSSIMLTSTAMLNGNISNTVQEEAEEVDKSSPRVDESPRFPFFTGLMNGLMNRLRDDERTVVGNSDRR